MGHHFAYSALMNPLSSNSLMKRLSMTSWGFDIGGLGIALPDEIDHPL